VGNSVSVLDVVRAYPKTFSEELGIDLKSRDSEEIFKWLLASILFAAPIRVEVAIRTYREFERRDLLASNAIFEAGRERIVKTLDEGGYTRYDFKTADKLMEVAGNLIVHYDGDLNLLHDLAEGSGDLERLIKSLGKGVGDVTVITFLRGLRGVWEKANPPAAPLVMEAARHFGITRSKDSKEVIEDLKKWWSENGIEGFSFTHFEEALLRYGIALRRGKPKRVAKK